MKQQNETEDHKLQTNQNSLIQSQSEEPKTVLITKQQPFQLQSNFKIMLTESLEIQAQLSQENNKKIKKFMKNF